MATELAVGYVTLLPSARGFGAGVAKELDGVQAVGQDVGQKTGEKFSSGFGSKLKVAAAVGAAFAAVKVKDFIGDSIGAASDLEESLSKVGQVFQGDAGIIQSFASDAAKALGQSEQQALEAAGTFGNLFTSMGLSTDAAAGMSTEVVTLASDLASFNNLAPEEALEKLRAGLVGEVEPLRALGVNFNAAEVEAKALKLGLEDANGEITESAKVQARMALILEKTTNAQGDFARTSTGLANTQRIASAQFKDLQATIGSAFLPVVTKLMSFVSTTMIPGIEKVGSVIAEAAGFVADNQEYFIAMGAAIAALVVPSFIAWASSAAAAAAATVLAALPVIALGAAVAALAAGVVWAYQNVDVFRNAVDTVARFLTNTFWPAILAGVGFLTDRLVPAIGGVIEWFGELMGKADALGTRIGETIEDIVGFFTELPSRLAGVAGDVFGFLRESFKTAINFIIRGWNGLEFKIPGFDPPGPGPKFGGFTLGLPQIDEFHTGGLYQAPRGASEGLALLQSGERVLSRQQTRQFAAPAGIGGGATIVVHNPVREASEDSIRRELRRLEYLGGAG